MVTATTPTPTAALSPRRQWAALAVLILAVLIISVDNTVLGFAVPKLSEDLNPTSNQLLWIVDAYAFVLAGLLVTMGNLGDRIGGRKLLLIGAAAFGAASVLAAFSTTPEMLIAARAVLGLAGATLMPSTLSLIRNIFTDPEQRRVAIGIWVGGFSVGAALGPVAGGWLLEHFWWGSVFLMAVPIMVALIVGGLLLLPETKNPNPGPFDLRSSFLSLLAMVPVVYALKVTAEHGVELHTLALAVFGVAMAVVFVRRQRRLDEPMLDISLFGHRPFAVAIATNLLVNFSLTGSLFFVAQYLQLVVGLGPMAAGLHLLPGMAVSLAASVMVAGLLRRGIAASRIMSLALVVAAAGYLSMLAFTDAGDGIRVVVTLVLIGLGIGTAGSLGTNLVMAAVPAHRAGSASAISETAFELGAALGIALLGSVVNAVFRRSVDSLANGETLGTVISAAHQLPAGEQTAVVADAQSAFTSGLHLAAVVGAVLLVAGSVAAGRFLRGLDPTAAPEH